MFRQHHATAVVAISIALTASLAPIAAADPPPLAHAEAAIATAHSNAPVRPDPDEQTVTAATVGTGPCSEVCSGGAASYGPVSQPSSAPRYSVPALPYSGLGTTAQDTAGSPPTVVRVVAPNGGFDWGDAAIGGGAMFVLLGIGFVGTRAATNGRRHHPREQRAAASS
jgi:hypothetical protein